MAETANWIDNVGEVLLSKDTDCFWLIPTAIFCNRRLNVASPWFSHEGETWRFVKTQVESNGYISLYLWTKSQCNPSCKYTVNFFLISQYGAKEGDCSERYCSDFGFEFLQTIIHGTGRYFSLWTHNISVCYI